jgi:hypothetical protein
MKSTYAHIVTLCFYSFLCTSISVLPLLSTESKAINTLVDEFLDLGQNPKKTFREYTEDLIQLLKSNPECKSFCLSLAKLKTSKNGTIVGLTFLQYKRLFSDELGRKVIDLGKTRLLEIFRQRTNTSV